jgi:hypothetical protein
LRSGQTGEYCAGGVADQSDTDLSFEKCSHSGLRDARVICCFYRQDHSEEGGHRRFESEMHRDQAAVFAVGGEGWEEQVHEGSVPVSILDRFRSPRRMPDHQNQDCH